MNYISAMEASQPERSAFQFQGDWKSYLPIALTNFLLTVVTLGLYRFWARARERRYLWGNTRFIDDNLEWTGTGKEMFLGFLMVVGALMLLYPVLAFVLVGLVMSGQLILAGLLIVAIYIGGIYLMHAAVFRSLRYQFSRTFWRGIRGGSDDSGWRYASTGLWMSLVAVLSAGLLVPWVSTRLWNRRWGKMSFGSHPFTSQMESGGLFIRYLPIYGVAIAGGLLLYTLYLGETAADPAEALAFGDSTVMFLIAALFVGLQLVSLSYYALFFRKAAEGASIAGLQFSFTARTADWLKLVLENIGLVLITLGVAGLFLRYRTWVFVIRHMEASGALDVEHLAQSSTRSPSDSEALADAFDVGAF